jgi:pilus assembly protein Flp/PilA
MHILINLGRNTSGASAAEYALILAIIGTGIAAAAFALGDSIADSFRAVAVQFAS